MGSVMPVIENGNGLRVSDWTKQGLVNGTLVFKKRDGAIHLEYDQVTVEFTTEGIVIAYWLGKNKLAERELYGVNTPGNTLRLCGLKGDLRLEIN